jgi:hypothetical protein
VSRTLESATGRVRHADGIEDGTTDELHVEAGDLLFPDEFELLANAMGRAQQTGE